MVAKIAPISIEEYYRIERDAEEKSDWFNGEIYRQLDSLKAYVLISQDHPHVEVYGRESDGTWRLSEARGLEAEIGIRAIGVTLNLADLFDRVDFGKERGEEHD